MLCVMCVGGPDRWICVKSPFLSVSGSDILFVSLSLCVCDVIIVRLDWWSYIIATATSAAVTGQEIEPLLFAIFGFLPPTDTKTHTQILGRTSKIQYRSKSMWTQDHHTCIYIDVPHNLFYWVTLVYLCSIIFSLNWNLGAQTSSMTMHRAWRG